MSMLGNHMLKQNKGPSLLLERNIEELKIVRFAKVGIVNTSLTIFTVFLLKNVFNIDYSISYGFGYLVGFISSFILNKTYTFNSSRKWARELPWFFLVNVLLYAASHILLVFLVEGIAIQHNFSILISMIFYSIFNYIFIKKIFSY